jgi:ribosome maturation factor RimP
MDRPLLSEAHFRRFIGRRVKLHLRWLVEGRRNIIGDLREVIAGNIIVRQDNANYEIPLDAVQSARLEPDL